jgi:exosortase/archaeosortase family protein
VDGGLSFGHGAFAYEVTRGCTGVMQVALLGAAMVAFPASWRHRFVGLSTATGVAFVVNVVRLVVLGAIGLHARSLFEAFHVYWFQALTILGLGLGWLAWAGAAARPEDSRSQRQRHAVKPRWLGAIGEFLGLFLALVALGFWLHGVNVYGDIVKGLAEVLSGLFDPSSPSTIHLSHDQLAYCYASQAALLALTVATPRRSGWRALRRVFIANAIWLTLAHGLALVGLELVDRNRAIRGVWATDPNYGFGLRQTPQLMLPLFALGIAPLGLWYRWARAEYPILRTSLRPDGATSA